VSFFLGTDLISMQSQESEVKYLATP